MVKRHAGGKNAKLLCCKRIFNRIKANLVKIQLKKHQNVQEMHFFAKSSRIQWVNYIFWSGLKVEVYYYASKVNNYFC